MKIFKTRAFAFILGAIIFSSITGVIASSLTASSISFEPTDENWNVTTVQGALNNLYDERNKDIRDLLSKTTKDNSCYQHTLVTAMFNRSTNNVFIRVKAINAASGCYTNFDIDLSEYNFNSLNSIKVTDLANNPNFSTVKNEYANGHLSIIIDTNKGWTDKQNMDVLFSYSYN